MHCESALKTRSKEAGGSGLNLVIILVVLAVVLHGVSQYGSVAYKAADMKKEMTATVLQVQASSGRRTSPAQDGMKRIELAVKKLELPEDTYINAQMVKGELTLEVAYQVEVPLLPFGLYNYMYVFDETATPAGFLMRDDAPGVR
jgi:hypothetical protein